VLLRLGDSARGARTRCRQLREIVPLLLMYLENEREYAASLPAQLQAQADIAGAEVIDPLTKPAKFAKPADTTDSC
jgi:hypothetical protein